MIVFCFRHFFQLKVVVLILSPPKSFQLTALNCLATNWEMSFDVWAPGVMIRLSNFCICISSEEFTYFKHCPAFKKFQQKNYTESSVKGSSIYLHHIHNETNSSLFSTSWEFQFWPHSLEVQISTAKYLPNIQTTLGGNDPDLKLRGPGRAGKPGPDDQHHRQHRVGRVGPVLDQHEVGCQDPSSLFARCPVPTTQSKAWYIAKHLTYRSIISSSQHIYISIYSAYIQTCLGSKLLGLKCNSTDPWHLFLPPCSKSARNRQELKDFQTWSRKPIYLSQFPFKFIVSIGNTHLTAENLN